MTTTDAYVLTLAWPQLASLDTYNQLGRVRDQVVFQHADDFRGRLTLSGLDGSALAWAQMTAVEPGNDVGTAEVQSAFEGSARSLLATTPGSSADALTGLEQDMEFYLRTLAEVTGAASPYLEASWSELRARWQGASLEASPDLSDAFPPQGATGDFLPTLVTLRAETEAALRTQFVDAAFEALSPWAIA